MADSPAMAATQLPPGPRFAPPQVVRYLADPIGFFHGLQRRYGDVVSFPFPYFGRVVLLTHPDGVKWAYRSKPSEMYAGEPQKPVLGPFFGDFSVFSLDEDEHMRHRKLLLPPFHGERVRSYTDLMREATEREIRRWPVGRPFSLRERQQYLTLEILLRSIFGIQDDALIEEFQHRITDMTRTRLGSPFVWIPSLRKLNLGPRGPWQVFLKRRAAVHELVLREIDRARSDPDLDSRDDVLASLVQARFEDGSAMTQEELRDELMTVVNAGHESTATALSWVFERILRHPRVERRLREEIEAGEDDAYLEATIKESLRVRPVIADTVRQARRDMEYGGYRIPKGSWVIPSVAAVHLRDDVFENAHEFRPERHLEGQAGTYSWIPFGGGVRRCIGAPFAMLEMKVIARTILASARLRAPDPRDEPMRLYGITVIPGRGTNIVVDERLRPRRREQSGEPLEVAAAVTSR